MNSPETLPDSWFLKTGGGEIFGPVTLPALQRWASAGRVTPDALISINQEKWKPAYLLDALAMNCVVRIRPGTFYGPIHASAVDVYIRDGVIPKTATVYITRPSEPLSAELDESSRHLETLETKLRDASSQRHQTALQKTALELTQTIAERDAANQRADELQASLHTAGTEIQRLTAAVADAQTLHADAEARFNDTLAKLTDTRHDKDALHVELDLLRDKQAATEQTLAESETTLSQFRATVHSLTEKLRRLTTECAEPTPFQSDDDAPEPPRTADTTFDPTAAEDDSPLARLEAQARAELAKLKKPSTLANLFKK